MPRAPANPSLPQNDSPQVQAQRAAQLAATRLVYEWDVADPNLTGVPLSAKVPPGDKPTIAWSIILIGIGLAIARNVITIKLEGVDKSELGAASALTAALAQCDAIEASVAAIDRQQAAKSGQSMLGRIIADVETGIADFAHDAACDVLDGHIETLRDLIELSEGDHAALNATRAPSIEAYRALFDTLPVPGIAWQFQEDDTFARMRVAGPNSVLIKAIAALPDNFPVTAAHYASVVNGDTLSAALAESRIFLCDYKELEVLVPGVWDGIAKYVYQPLALFAVPPGGRAIVPVAIQCGQDPGANPVILPSGQGEARWTWEIAKFIVQVADGNYHELFVHLARTHLVIEAVAVATHRHLAELHPIWALLVPHFEGTLFINDQAAGSLIAPNGPIDHIFGGTIATSQLAAIEDRLAFDFAAHMLPHDLATRGVAAGSALIDYPYRDDALLVWQAIADWAKAYVDLYYADDAAVAGDTELQAWASALAVDGKLAGLPLLATRQALVDTCTMIMFTASAQHAAVNFPQKDIMAFAPSVTGAGWAAAPAQQGGGTKVGWIAAMPPVSLALEQLNTLWLLGSLHYRPLGDYRSNDLPYLPWFQDPAVIGAEGPLVRFQAELQVVEAQIVARNAARMYPYPYLQPSLIPTSINI